MKTNKLWFFQTLQFSRGHSVRELNVCGRTYTYIYIVMLLGWVTKLITRIVGWNEDGLFYKTYQEWGQSKQHRQYPNSRRIVHSIQKGFISSLQQYLIVPTVLSDCQFLAYITSHTERKEWLITYFWLVGWLVGLAILAILSYSLLKLASFFYYLYHFLQGFK